VRGHKDVVDLLLSAGETFLKCVLLLLWLFESACFEPTKGLIDIACGMMYMICCYWCLTEGTQGCAQPSAVSRWGCSGLTGVTRLRFKCSMLPGYAPHQQGTCLIHYDVQI
jgi:hypothetical protein